jgi:hypothetical protein
VVPVADHDAASFQGGADHLGQQLCPRGHEQQHLRLRGDVPAVQEHLSHSLAEGRPARLADDQR